MNIELNNDVLNFLEGCVIEFNDIEDCFYQYVLYRSKNSEKIAWKKTINYCGANLEPSEVADYVDDEIVPKCSNFELSLEIADYAEELGNL